MPMSWEMLYAERTSRMKNSEIREFFKLTERPDVISFAGGFPSPKCFPKELIAQVLKELVLEEGPSVLQYGPTEGNNMLRLWLARKMEREGISASEDNILITNGSQQGLDLLGKVLLNPNDLVVVEEPGYVGGLGAISNYQGNILPIPIDEEGLCTPLLEKKLKQLRLEQKKVKLVYVVPNFQNPTGVTMSLSRRQHLLRLASNYNFIIIEDNPYGELRYEGEAIPSLKSMDKEGRVIYLGSFSKIFTPGIRVGWITAESRLIEKLIAAKQATDLCSNTLGQRLALYFSEKGLIEEGLQGLISYYRGKRDLMLASMEEYFPAGINWTRPAGGFFIWVTFPTSMNARSLLLKSLEKIKVAFVDGAGFFTGGYGQNTARFSFSEASPEEIREGIARLGGLLKVEMDGIGLGEEKAEKEVALKAAVK